MCFKGTGIFLKKQTTVVRIARIYNNLGARYSELEYYDEALNYYQKAADINEILKDNRKLAFNYGNIGLLYYDQYEDEKALEYFQKSIQLQDTVMINTIFPLPCTTLHWPISDWNNLIKL